MASTSKRRAERWYSTLGARLLLGTRIVDSAFRVFERARSSLVAALAPDAVLERFSEIAYGKSESYRADAPAFRTYLFPWEERAIAQHFPRPPARVLVGGAGGGREAFALAGMGYHVIAFEPSPPLAATLARAAPSHCEAYRAGYDDMPQLFAALPGGRTGTLEELAPFDASIIGWGSFSHLLREAGRVQTLQTFGALTRGPILVSFLGVWTDRPAASVLERLRDRLPRLEGRSAADIFSPYIGFFHRTDEAEVRRQAAEAGLEVRELNFDTRDTNWPHAVLTRSGESAA